MKTLVTGGAGFIGFHLTQALLSRGDQVVNIDNLNHYYNPQLKYDRLAEIAKHPHAEQHEFIQIDIGDRPAVASLFNQHKFDVVVNLAAQAGVRYSIDNPHAYVDSNLVGFVNILEGCRYSRVKHLVYASSSSVYGANTTMPFSVHHNVDHPLSLYAATKKANELMAHTYSHLYGLPTTGLRFFTVYGPWDRPDMALQKFAQAITRGEAIKVYNYGNHRRDFTYIEDIVEGLIRILDRSAPSNLNWSGENPDPGTSKAPWRVYNIGNNRPVNLMEYIGALEKALGKEAKKEFLPMQPGDVLDTWANVDDLVQEVNYRPSTSIKYGIREFSAWFNDYYLGEKYNNEIYNNILKR